MTKEIIINAETGEVTERDFTAKELKDYEKAAAENAAIAQAAAEAKAKAEADKAALLARLGLTEDELKTILG